MGNRRSSVLFDGKENYQNMSRKALFFDIDGTLLSEITRQVPESAKEALKDVYKRQEQNLLQYSVLRRGSHRKAFFHSALQPGEAVSL